MVEILEKAVNDLEAKVIKTIAVRANKPDLVITKDTKLTTELGLDSLDSVELIMALEEEHEISIPEEAATTFTTVGDVTDFVLKCCPPSADGAMEVKGEECRLPE